MFFKRKSKNKKSTLIYLIDNDVFNTAPNVDKIFELAENDVNE